MSKFEDYRDTIYSLKKTAEERELTMEEQKIMKLCYKRLEAMGREYEEPEPEDHRNDENFNWSGFYARDEDREQEYNFYKERGKRRAEYEEKKKAKDRRYTRWFNTWPRRGTDNLNKVLEALEANCETHQCAIRYYIIAREHHEDGGEHIHAYFELTKRLYWNAHIWDIFVDDENGGDVWHGKYDGARSWRRCIIYLKKERDYITNINIRGAMRKQAKARDVLEMDPLDALDEGFINYLQLNNFMANRSTYMNLKRKREPPKPCKNKKRHYWYYGVSNTGKTYMQREDMAKHPNDWFKIPYDLNWVGYENQKYLYADEFKGQITIQYLNELCDGGKHLEVKYASALLHEEPIIMICSNYCPEDCYHNANKEMIKTLLNRFNVIELTKIYEE